MCGSVFKYLSGALDAGELTGERGKNTLLAGEGLVNVYPSRNQEGKNDQCDGCHHQMAAIIK